MEAPFVPAVDLATWPTAKQGLSKQQLNYFGAAYGVVTDSTVDSIIGQLCELQNLRIYLNVTLCLAIEDILGLLDAGAAKVFVTLSQLTELRKHGVETARLVLCPTINIEEELSTLVHDPVPILLQGIKSPARVEALLKELGHHHPSVYVTLAEPTQEDAHDLGRKGITTILPAALLTTDPKKEPKLIDAAALLYSRVSSDRADDLALTVVTDERGIALGAVYSNLESVSESLRLGRGVYMSRKRGLWYKGESSGDVQELVRIEADCDSDCLRFVVRQKGRGFCHLGTASCFGEYTGLAKLQQTLSQRKVDAPPGSYTSRLFSDSQMLDAKILEEANELCEATAPAEIAFEAADLMYFALTKCIAAGVSLQDVEYNLDLKSRKIKRRRGDAKPQYAAKIAANGDSKDTNGELMKEAASVPKTKDDPAGTLDGQIKMRRFVAAEESSKVIEQALQRPSQRSNDKIMGIVNPIIQSVRKGGDAAVLEYTHKFEKATSLTSPVLRAPFAPELMQLSPETQQAIDISYDNIWKFHAAQKEEFPLVVETMPGVVCTRFSRPIHSVGLYIPGGTAVLPSTTLMLGIPAKVAGCNRIIVASPPRSDGSISPEIVYVAHKVGAESIVLAGGAQAVAAMAYGTESVHKVDKILGPGNQFVTAAKMLVANDTTAGVSIDMPAGPSEVLVIADKTSIASFVASDLLSQAEHGVDSQVVLIAVGLDESELENIEHELHKQASALPRVDIVRGAIEHSVTLVVKDMQEAMRLSNMYAPEHLILSVDDAIKIVPMVENAGSVFIGHWTPESVGDYSAGVNHSLPTYGYAKQYSGVNVASYLKHITSSQLTREGLRNVGGAVMQLAKVEQLEAHRRAVSIRLAHMYEGR